MAVSNPQVISDYIAEELAADRLIELIIEEAKNLGIHCSPIGIIPKKNKPGKWRLMWTFPLQQMLVSTMASRRSYMYAVYLTPL